MVRMCAVSYLNTKPFIAGLERYFRPTELDLQLLIPSACGEHFAQHKVDFGLVPVGSLAGMPEVHLLNNYCIGADGEVDSVFLFARKPLSHIRRVYLDGHSRSSNNLTRILFRKHWQQAVEYRKEPDYFGKIKGEAAGVVIGERAVALRNEFKVVIDLAAAWKEWTGLPFTFAVWAYHPRQFPALFRDRLYKALTWGMQNLPKVAERYASMAGYSPKYLLDYYRHRIDYRFDEAKHFALELYLKELCSLEGLTPPAVHLDQPVVFRGIS